MIFGLEYQTIGIIVLWTFLLGYVIVGSIDWGAGFFALYGRITGRTKDLNQLIARYLNPVWEVTNVFFVFFFVGIVGFFPETAYYYGSTLLIPASISLIILSIRGAFYAFENYGIDSKLSWTILYGLSGLFIPASLSVALVISEGNYIVEGANGHYLDWQSLILSPYAWSVVLLAIISVLYISSAFLTTYAHIANETRGYSILRRWFLMWAGPMIFTCLFVFISLREHNHEHFMNAVNNQLWLFIASFILFIFATLLYYLKKAHTIAFICVFLQFSFAWFGYGMSKMPYILYPYINVNESVVNPSMALSLTIAFILGLLLLVPSLLLLLKLFVFNKAYVKGMK